MRILRRPAVLESVGVGKSTLYRLIAAGDFPAPVRLGIRGVGWHEADVIAWIQSRTAVPTGPAPVRTAE